MRSLLGLLVVAALTVGGGAPAHAERVRIDAGEGPLTGRTVVIDPGHQLGNHRFPRKISRPVPAGGFKKACNTTGTSTNGGFPEATFNWKVAQLLRDRLESRGARVILTRATNSRSHGDRASTSAVAPATGSTPISRSASTATATTAAGRAST